jgi:hypothetical protein
VPAAVPVRVRDLDDLVLDALLLGQPLLAELLALGALLRLALAVREEGRVDLGVLEELLALR